MAVDSKFLGRSIESDNNLRFTGLQCRIVVGYPAWSWNLHMHHDEPRFSGGWFKFVGGGFPTMTCKSYLKLYTDVDIKEALNSRRPLKNDASDHHTKPQNDIAFRSSKEYESSFRKQKICRRMIHGSRPWLWCSISSTSWLHDTFAWWRCDFLHFFCSSTYRFPEVAGRYTLSVR